MFTVCASLPTVPPWLYMLHSGCVVEPFFGDLDRIMLLQSVYVSNDWQPIVDETSSDSGIRETGRAPACDARRARYVTDMNGRVVNDTSPELADEAQRAGSVADMTGNSRSCLAGPDIRSDRAW